jgi:hypothetical protein
MREAACVGKLAPRQAYIAYEQVKGRGIFLLVMTSRYFDY